VRAAIGDIKLRKKKPFNLENIFGRYLVMFQKEVGDDKFLCLNQEKDILFMASTQLIEKVPVKRIPRNESERTQVWYGNIGSGNSMMKNSEQRDTLRDKYNLIGLEMEAAGIMNNLPTGVIRGVCDYGDGQKNKDWQPYAAAVAAVYAKGVLYNINIRPKVAQVFTSQLPLS
jgi:nucleoside phosphorylase